MAVLLFQEGCGVSAKLGPNLAPVAEKAERIEIDLARLPHERRSFALGSEKMVQFGALEIRSDYRLDAPFDPDTRFVMSERDRPFADLRCFHRASTEFEIFQCEDDARGLAVVVDIGDGIQITSRRVGGLMLMSQYSYPEVLGPDSSVATILYEMTEARWGCCESGHAAAGAVTNPTNATLFVAHSGEKRELALAGFLLALVVQPPFIQSWQHRFQPKSKGFL